MNITESRVSALKKEVELLERAQQRAFKAPSKKWIEDRVANIKEVFEAQPEESAMLLRKLLGTVFLKPVFPDNGKPYLMALSSLQPLALFETTDP